MEYLDVLSRWTHVGTAIVIVGGGFFLRFVLLPAVANKGDAAADIKAEIHQRWKKFVHAGIGLFLLSGFYNYFRLMSGHKGDTLWHILIGTKILVAFVIFYLLSVLVGRSAKFDAMRQRQDVWLGRVLLLAAVVVGISGYAKVNLPARPKPPAAAAVETPEATLGEAAK